MALIKRGEIWHVRAQVGGVTIARSTKTTNKRLAEQIEAKWISEVHQEVVVAGRKPITVEKAILKFLESRRGTAGYINAEIKLRMFSKLNSKFLHQVTQAEVTNLANDAIDDGYSINTVNVSLVYWNALQNFANSSGFTAGVKVKKLKGATGRINFLSDEEVARLLAELHPDSGNFREKRKAQDNYDFVVALLHTGAREQEIAKLQLSQIDTTANTITIHRSKGGTNTTLRMSKLLTEVVARRMVAAETELPEGSRLHGRVGNGYLFPERADARYNNEWFQRACKRAKLKDVNLHTLRHTAAVKWLKSGLSIVEVQHLLGHKNISSTMCYLHVVPNLAGEKAAAVFDV